jgi:hypothetical protein
VRAAAGHLDAAGMHELANELRRQADRADRADAADRADRADAADHESGRDEIVRQIEELRRSVERLRAEVAALRAQREGRGR